ncbi:MAG: hypothetical protein KDA80_05920 [Planctomycetaceae bacterium]|nr:hypothetical protein [Planctomycetaceae bacterium]
MFEQSAHSWQILHCGDANWLAIDHSHTTYGRVIGLFHETVGDSDSHAIVASSFADALKRLLRHKTAYWLDDSFQPLGWLQSSIQPGMAGC